MRFIMIVVILLFVSLYLGAAEESDYCFPVTAKAKAVFKDDTLTISIKLKQNIPEESLRYQDSYWLILGTYKKEMEWSSSYFYNIITLPLHNQSGSLADGPAFGILNIEYLPYFKSIDFEGDTEIKLKIVFHFPESKYLFKNKDIIKINIKYDNFTFVYKLDEFLNLNRNMDGSINNYDYSAVKKMNKNSIINIYDRRQCLYEIQRTNIKLSKLENQVLQLGFSNMVEVTCPIEFK